LPLTTGVTGTLPIANGGTGTTSTTFVNAATNVTGTLPIANGGTNSTATATSGGVGYGTGTAHAYTSAGTAGQFLQSNGTSAPTWVAASAGALTFISSQTVSSAVSSVDFTSGISSTYDDYIVYFEGLTPSSTGVDLRLRLYKSGGFTNSGYSSSYARFRTVSESSSSNTVSYIFMTGASASVDNTVSVISGQFKLFNMNSTEASRSTVAGQLFYNTASASNNQSQVIFAGNQSTAAASTGFQFFFDTGNIATGTFRLYGVAKS
jgi:hypothetical protein